MSAQADAFMGIFGFKRMTCKSCTHSISLATALGMVLYCQKHDKDTATVSECDSFCYEPGSDEGEHD